MPRHNWIIKCKLNAAANILKFYSEFCGQITETVKHQKLEFIKSFWLCVLSADPSLDC